VATRRMAARRTITGSLSDVQRRLKYVESRPTPSQLANQVVRRNNLQPRSVSTDQIALRSVTNTLIEQKTITSNELADNAVTSSVLAPQSVTTESFVVGAVTAPAIANDAVTADAIADGAITEPAVATDSIGDRALQSNSVGESELKNNSVSTAKIRDSAVTEAKLNNGAVTENKIALNAVTSGKINTGAVTAAKIGSGAVTTIKIGDAAVTDAKIGDAAVTNAKIQNGAVSIFKIGVGAVDTLRIASGSTIATNVLAGAGLLRTTSGISGSGTSYTLTADFGTGSNQLPRGNHIHPISSSQVDTIGTTGVVTNHTHQYLRANSPTLGWGVPPSSRKLKKEISNFVIEDPKKILNLQAKTYKYKNQLKSYHVSKNRQWLHGYIAEEVVDLGLEELVGYDKKGKPNSLDYSLISLFLVELAKVHQNEIDSLKEEVQRLKEER